MVGIRSGAAKQLFDEEPRELYTHCYIHAINLACSNAIKQYGFIKDLLGITHELTKLLKNSPRRDACFKTLQTETAPDTIRIRTLCPTCWMARAKILKVWLIIMRFLMSSGMNALNLLNECMYTHGVQNAPV